MKLKDFDFRLWNDDIKKYGILEGELSTKGKINGKSVAIIPLYKNDSEIELCVGVDRKGKKIYEGDIVIFRDIKDELWVVELKVKGHLEAIIKPLNHNERKNILLPKYCEVIGNIHENPELIGDEE